eukprot:5275585-Amphidinium_carterae.1
MLRCILFDSPSSYVVRLLKTDYRWKVRKGIAEKQSCVQGLFRDGVQETEQAAIPVKNKRFASVT